MLCVSLKLISLIITMIFVGPLLSDNDRKTMSSWVGLMSSKRGPRHNPIFSLLLIIQEQNHKTPILEAKEPGFTSQNLHLGLQPQSYGKYIAFNSAVSVTLSRA